MSSKDEGSAVSAQNKGSWSSFLKSIATFNGDLSTMTAPAFILSTTSLTEFSAYWVEHPSVFVAPANEPDPAKRALLVLKWFLSTLKPSYSSRNEKLGSEKKPLNPFLGELYLGRWEDKAGTTQLVSEQVSHHPPVTAYCIWNAQHGVRLQGYNAQKASFSRTINVKQIGHALYHLDGYNEDYLITLPAIHIEGLITGSPYVELNKSTYIQSSSGFTAKIEYAGKGWVSGKKNSFTAQLYPTGKEKEPLYTLDGQWTDSFTIKEGDGKHKARVIDTYDAKALKGTPLITAPIEQQDPLESQRAWQKVAAAIVKGDMDKTSYEKSIIENQQRELRKKEAAEGREWERTFFTKVDRYPIFEQLAKPLAISIDADKTNGIWLFDSNKAMNAKPPFNKKM
ncbi:oxysterol binding protein-like protein [Cryomyces antarcticus]